MLDRYDQSCIFKILLIMEAFFFYLVFIIILCFLTKKLLSHGRHFPPSPPFSLPIIGHLHLFKKPLHRAFAKLSDRHGPVLSLRFGSCPVLLVSSPSIAEECFSKNDVVFANRPRFLAGKYLGYDYTMLGWAPYGDHWRNLRRIASLEILSSHRLQMFHNIRSDEVRSMIHSLFRDHESKGGFQEVEIKTLLFELLLNVMMRMIAGKRYYGDNVKEIDKARDFKEMVQETFRLSGATNLVDFIPLLRWVGLSKGMERRMMALQEKRVRFTMNLIDERKSVKKTSERSSDRTMIDVLLSLQETEPEYYKDEIISGMILNMLSAGTDTSVLTTEWALSLLLNNPEALLKAQAEIDDAQIGLLDESDLCHLPYLQAIVNETLRMCPVGPLLVPHASSDHCTVGGFTIERGTILLVNVWAIQNDPDYWSEPEKFKPERFLQMDQVEGEKERYRFVPFGAGRRRCPGEGLAMKIVGLALGSLIQCFEWERVSEKMVDMSEGEGLTMPKLHPLVAKYRPRSAMLPLLSQRGK